MRAGEDPHGDPARREERGAPLPATGVNRNQHATATGPAHGLEVLDAMHLDPMAQLVGAQPSQPQEVRHHESKLLERLARALPQPLAIERLETRQVALQRVARRNARRMGEPRHDARGSIAPRFG